MNWVVNLSDLTLPVATMICTTWAVIANHGFESVLLFLSGMGFTLLIKLLDHNIYLDRKRWA